VNLSLDVYWHLPILLVTFSLVYSATRHDRWDRILWEALGWLGRIGSFLLLVGVGLFIASSFPDQWPILATITAIGMGIYWYLTGRKMRQEQKAAQSNPTPSSSMTKI
jgi:hypothetical protein